MLLRTASIVVLLALVGAGIIGAGCSNGTTPVCDDAGSCLILQPSDDAGASPDTGGSGDGPIE
jgi:hypothetical protein